MEVVRRPQVAFSDFSPDGWCDVCGAVVDYDKNPVSPFTCRCQDRYLLMKRLKAHKPVLSLRRTLP